jgi:CRISPR-associated protein Csx16
MTTWFVSRHPGARDWAQRHNIRVDRQVNHIEMNELQPGDVVIGTLPVHLAAAVCARGASYLHLSLTLPEALRGQELSADDMEACSARLEAFFVRKEDQP